MNNFHSSGSFVRWRRVALLLIAVGLIISSPTNSQRPAAAGNKIGKLPKDSVAQRQLRMTDGSQHSLLSLRGKVIVVNFFAVWCGHSRDQIPSLIKLSESASSRGVQVIGLAVEDDRTTAEKVSDFISAQRINYPVGMVSDPVFMEFVSSRVVDVPQTLVYGRDGKLAAHVIGHDAQTDATIADAVRKELDKK
jgi:thiol-disulfide isomerase/thioredoxin